MSTPIVSRIEKKIWRTFSCDLQLSNQIRTQRLQWCGICSIMSIKMQYELSAFNNNVGIMIK